MSSADYPPVMGSVKDFPVRHLGKTTILSHVTFRTYSPSFIATFGKPFLAYDQFAATLHHIPTTPPDLRFPHFTAEFPRFSRHMTFLGFCKNIDAYCVIQGKWGVGRKDKEHRWVRTVLEKFQRCTLWDRGALVGRDVGRGRRLGDLEEVQEQWAVENLLSGMSSVTLEGPETEYDKEDKEDKGDSLPTTDEDVSME
ncbi:hypothetical protein GLAREA_07005 [Glarea lozoyensis ATCC 20868]|uniref:Uncharacterized protein n=1 Tax=Glarea lozoyensis (strain ATCC 20868 / MF5171) TaxID=1116229 RepID=S3D686_GLAL2|nr:uncharacterized protein GLAREA_07005 [Glarea lozoyensis ATCC 20868]EPE33992.1 hypothetical protein GLAREA_07005 [Glarea lozoyensis ATCC 20868]